jgi:hypothetical protein
VDYTDEIHCKPSVYSDIAKIMSAPSPQKRRETAKQMIREFGVTVDGRSRAAKALRRFRAQLIQHVGGSPSIAQEALINSACQIRLRLLALDQSFATHGTMTETESRHYRGWTQNYHAALRDVGLEAAPQPKPRWQPPAPSQPGATPEALAAARAKRMAERAAVLEKQNEPPVA